MPFKNITDEELALLKQEFNQLKTIEEKFKFWRVKLRHNYMWVGVTIPLAERGINDFLIKPNNEAETEEFNLHLLEEVSFTDSLRAGGKVMVDSETLVLRLSEKLKDVVNPKPLLESEISWIDSEVEKYQRLPRTANDSNHFFKMSLSACWLKAYEEYYLKRREVSMKHTSYSYATLMGGYAGCELAKYRVYVERKLEEVKNNQTPLAQEDTPLKRQLLIMLYTGMLDKLDHVKNKDRNKLLSVLLNRSEQSIKTELTNIHKRSRVYKIRTEENYSFLLDLFEQVQLNEQVEEVKNELDKLNGVKK
ncbi:hypothetical protein CLV24_12031 [Pontibacter ummariensis]|uniref:Uncharacterized protein n=1 Tax=Pontibacter ummariensis TaxID=1610492 RepID=A0A239J3S2_9BACT|nr:hypothetical protein [Pontibacter ummariensis]PRY08867.1 hypothetical protein CLV24_12031 [Pontibacter ummariensis]SNT00460.1 hypothetical protein SAMN06296052_12030 [Pontibacter ummariensis]